MMQKKSHTPQESSLTQTRVIALVISLIALAWGYYMYTIGKSITGPFIFGDEATYFAFSKGIYNHKNLASFPQYGPLYPFLISAFLALKNLHLTYQWIRVFNILVFLSAAIPAYLLGGKLFTNPWLKALLPFLVLLTPFSGTVHLIWAEPIYIAIFYWACLSFVHFLEKPAILNSFLLGLFLSLLYYTKPAAGLVTQLAAFFTVIFYCIGCRKTLSKRVYFMALMAVLSSVLLILPWVLHYLKLGMSLVGYPSATNALSSRISQSGYMLIALDTLKGLFFQFSYFFVGSWGLISIIIFTVFREWQGIPSIKRHLALFLLLAVLGLISLSAFGMASFGLDPRMTQGRYYSLLLPIIIVLGLDLTLNQDKKTLLFLVFAVVTTLIAIIASPFFTRSPLAFNSMPDLSPFIYIGDHAGIVWRATIKAPPLFLRVVIPVVFGIFTLLAYCFSTKKRMLPLLALIVAMGMSFSSYTEQYYITMVGTSEFHDLFFYLNKHQIDLNKVAFDKGFEGGNVYYLADFWSNQLAHFESSATVSNQPYTYFISADELSYKKVFASKLYGTYKIYKIQ